MMPHEQHLALAQAEAQRLLVKTHRRVWVCFGCGEELKKNETLGPCRKCGSTRYDSIWKPKTYRRPSHQRRRTIRKGNTR